MSLLDPSYFLHVANILFIVAYSVRDILWLRLFAVAILADRDTLLRPSTETVVGTDRLE
jgi:hypothetical protein